MCPILTASTPRESNETPWEVRGCCGHRECRNMSGCKDHICGSCPLMPPTGVGWHVTNRGGSRPPSTMEIWPKKPTTTLASPYSASALPGDVGNDQAHICARF